MANEQTGHLMKESSSGDTCSHLTSVDTDNCTLIQVQAFISINPYTVEVWESHASTQMGRFNRSDTTASQKIDIAQLKETYCQLPNAKMLVRNDTHIHLMTDTYDCTLGAQKS
uniref:SFRICE_009670 n=1 Tax=Spodoptera frugiperda TaxID=7108 RepID=A0A2H1VQH4_SPOFR